MNSLVRPVSSTRAKQGGPSGRATTLDNARVWWFFPSSWNPGKSPHSRASISSPIKWRWWSQQPFGKVVAVIKCNNVYKMPTHSRRDITLDMIPNNCTLFSQIHTRSSSRLVNFLCSNYKKKKKKKYFQKIFSVVFGVQFIPNYDKQIETPTESTLSQGLSLASNGLLSTKTSKESCVQVSHQYVST